MANPKPKLVIPKRIRKIDNSNIPILLVIDILYPKVFILTNNKKSFSSQLINKTDILKSLTTTNEIFKYSTSTLNITYL